MLYIGIDLGTSSVKMLLMDAKGGIRKTVSRSYPLHFPRDGWAEQDPHDWIESTVDALAELTAACDKREIAGISFGGQMHGLVVLDENDEIIRPAILWNDGRTVKETEYLNTVISKSTLAAYTMNIAYAGFTAPKLLWMRKHEPENFKRIRKIMLPKDYLSYRLSGVFASDMSDASGLLLLDVKNRTWSREMLDICGVTEDQLPSLYESYEVVGTLTPEMARRTGLSERVKIIAGAGDNAAAAIGTGAVKDGDCNISIGTSGTIFMPTGKPLCDEGNALHSFAHAAGNYHLMGVVMSAASCNKWWCEEILHTSDFPAEQEKIEHLGENRVFFLPFLMGDRTPYNDTDVRATFIGMSMDTTRAEMTQAMLEGVAFSLRESVEIARDLGIEICRATVCGGGAKSPLWKRIIASVLNVTLEKIESEEGPALGGAILAAVGCGEYGSVEEATEAIVKVIAVTEPEPELVEKYNQRYREYKRLYPAIQHLFH